MIRIQLFGWLRYCMLRVFFASDRDSLNKPAICLTTTANFHKFPWWPPRNSKQRSRVLSCYISNIEKAFRKKEVKVTRKTLYRKSTPVMILNPKWLTNSYHVFLLCHFAMRDLFNISNSHTSRGCKTVYYLLYDHISILIFWLNCF